MDRMSELASHHVEGRGVWIAPWLDADGRPQVVAVDREGRQVARTSVPEDARPGAVLARMEALLDLLDPEVAPELEVVP